MTGGISHPAMAPLLAAGAHPLVHLNAALNSLATVLLLVALWQAKRGLYAAHGRTMLSALVVSAVFLVSYLTYHAIAGSVPFTYPGPIRYVYYVILVTHVLLAFTVPFLALAAAWQGAGALAWRGGSSPSPERQETARQKHLKIVRWAYPIWLYVSITGVVVYAMLYHIWPSSAL